jgi:hypothetical protein
MTEQIVSSNLKESLLNKAKQDPYTVHSQTYSPLLDAWIDEKILNFIEYLKLENISTLHSCEGDPVDFYEDSQPIFSENSDLEDNGKGYIHFYNAEHLEKAIIASDSLARQFGDETLSRNILQQKEFFLNENNEFVLNYFTWDYEISWTTVHPWNQHERHNPYQGHSLTAVLRIPHNHLILLNTYSVQYVEWLKEYK